MPVPTELEPYIAGMELRRIVDLYGLQNIQAILGLIAERNRRELIARRSGEMLDAWKANIRPLAAPVKIPDLSTLRTARNSRVPGYRGHLEEHLDRIIRKQARAQELEDGLAAMTGIDSWERRELTEIVDRSIAGETAQEIAQALPMKLRTVERRLEELREAGVRKVD